MAKKIADISRNQGDIDWGLARKELDFVIFRASKGDYADNRYLEYTSQCGVPYAAYHYVKAATASEARTEARFFVECANKAHPLFYIGDVEYEAQTEMTTEPVCVAFLDELRKLGCKRIGLYINRKYDWAGKAIDMCDIMWIPHWGPNDGTVPTSEYEPKHSFDLWQYTSRGRVAGIDGNVDLSILRNRTLDWLISGESDQKESVNKKMKYNNTNKPIICMQSQSTCYRGTKPMDVWGILWHSTGANNPNLSRYIQPSDSLAGRSADTYKDRNEALAVIGVNKYGNDINHKERNMGMNGWIGKLANGEVAAVQTMPWNWAPWGCGAGSKGSCNSHWIQFEICEDNLQNPDYAMQVYKEACELTAYLCKMFNINPFATVQFKGVTVPTIIDHKTSHALGLGNNHGDIEHWFPKVIDKTLEDIRKDVAALMNASGDIVVEPPVTPPTGMTTTGVAFGSHTIKRGVKGSDVKELQEKLMALGYKLPKYGADSDCGGETVNAIIAFQKDNGLTADGIFGAKSFAKLNELLASKPGNDGTTNGTIKLAVTGNAVNVRNAPSITMGKIMYVVKKNDILNAIAIDAATKWYKLEDGNYISNLYVSAYR